MTNNYRDNLPWDSDRQSKRDFTATTITEITNDPIADENLAFFYECKNDSNELKKALERGEIQTLEFVPFDSPEAFKKARADIYFQYGNNKKIGFECKESGDDKPSDYKSKLEEGVYCDLKKIEFFKLMYRAYGIRYYWVELYCDGVIRVWDLKAMGVLDGTRVLETKTCMMPEISIDPNSRKVPTTKGLLPVEEAWLLKRVKGENMYDRQQQNS